MPEPIGHPKRQAVEDHAQALNALQEERRALELRWDKAFKKERLIHARLMRLDAAINAARHVNQHLRQEAGL